MAGCTLDASAKIYAGRVDSIYNDACKMVGGLGRSDRHGKGVVSLLEYRISSNKGLGVYCLSIVVMY